MLPRSGHDSRCVVPDVMAGSRTEANHRNMGASAWSNRIGLQWGQRQGTARGLNQCTESAYNYSSQFRCRNHLTRVEHAMP